MIWRSRYGLLFVFLLIGTSHGRKPLEKTEKETPEPDSVSDDKKVSSSISQLLRSLAAPAESERRGRSRPVEIITKNGIISARGQSARKLYFGVDPVSPGGSVASGVPPPVVVSSQAIRISGGSGANGTGGNKRARSLFTAQTSTVDKDGVKTIEGVRVPDDEHDKHHTWRNARVIKNFLVENNRPANPHRKRQIMIQDASQYLAGQGVSPTSYAYADASTLAQVASQALNLNPAQGQTLYYATQPQQQSAQTAQDLTSAIYAAAAASQQQQQQQYQYQAAPASTTGTGSSGKSQQHSYATQQQQQQQQPQQGQMYVLQPDGKTYLPYTAGMQLTSAQLAAVAQAQDPQANPQNLGQLQFASRSLEATSSEEATNARQSQIQLHQQQVHQQQQIQQYQLQQQALKLQQQQQLQQEQQQQQQLQQQQQHKKLQQEQEYQKLILSKHQNAQHQQKKQQQSQQSQSQQKPQVSVHAHSGQVPSVTPASHSPAGSPSTPSPLLHKVAASPEQLQLQQLAHIAATAAPTGASIGQQLQEQVSAQSAYFLQQSDASRPQSLSLADTQSTQQQQVLSHSGGLFPLSHGQIPTVSILQDRSSPGMGQVGVGAMPVSASQFVIQPQTYMAGGGQMFSVPVPIPIDQIHHASEQHHQILQHPHYEKDQESSGTKKEAKNTLTNKLMESLNFSMNKRTAERLETSTIVPVLASAGIVLGLGALAAGWYLSQNNREVGILKKSGKFGNNMNNNNMNMNNMNGNNMGNLPAPANSANNGGKDNAVIAHVRRRRETQGGEVDQASFFQSIIQHGIEKQQQQYESAEPAQFDPQPSRKQYSSNNNNNNNDLFSSSSAPLNRVREEQVQIKPMSYTRHSERISERDRERDRGDRDRGDRDRVDRDRDHNRDRERDSYNGYGSGSSSSSSNNIKNYRADDRESLADKSGKGGGGQSKVKNFAKVAIPAIILGGSVVVIGALIFGWYVSGKNREIAFLEPSAYSRRKRSLSSLSLSSSALSDSWLHHTLTTIHSNPYETKGSPAYDANHPHPVDSDNTSKHGTLLENKLIPTSDLTNLSVALGMAAFAIGSMTVLGLAWYFTDNSRGVGWDHGGHSFGHWPTTTYKQPKHSKYSKKHGMLHRRSLPSTNEMVVDLPDNPSFLHKILGNLEFSQNSLLNKLQETDYSKWQETPCAQRIFCDVMSTQGDDTVRLMEKRMTKFLSMLPETLSDSLAQRLGSVMSAINKKDCSAYTCGGHWVDSTVISQPSAPASQPR